MPRTGRWVVRERLTDSAGNERTVEQVQRLARETMFQMGEHVVLDMMVGMVGVEGLPAELTRCDCHGLWYDECEVYA